MNAHAKQGRQNPLGLWEYFALAAGFVLLVAVKSIRAWRSEWISPGTIMSARIT